jgi:hypothetical protein
MVFVGNERIEITNGVLSGWRWTAMLDTIINLAELDLAKQWVESNSTIKIELLDFNAQGDDDWLKIRTYKMAIALWLAYESFGLFVNPGKFFLDKERDEYLRRVMDKGIVTGYPARSVASILFRDPTSPKEPVGTARIRSTFGKWKLFAERLDVDFRNSWFFRRYLQDAVQGTRGVTKQIVENYTMLSAGYGGIGLDNKGYIETKIPPTSEPDVDVIDLDSPGYLEWVEFGSKFGVDVRDARRFAVSTLDLDGRYAIPKWIKYIYTHEPLNTSIPHGLKTGLPGTVGVGPQVLNVCRKNNWRWFPTYNSLTHIVQYDLSDFTIPEWLDFKKINIPIRPLSYFFYHK